MPPYLRLWRRFVILALVRSAEYRANFVVTLLEGVAQMGLAVVVVALLYRYTDEVAGWSAVEVLMLTGVYRAMDGLIACQIAPNMLRMTQYISRGELDFVLLRPVSSQFLVSLRWLDPPEAVNGLIGLALVAYAGTQAGVDWAPLTLLTAAVLAACGLAALYGLWFATVTCAFWLIRVEPLGFLFYDVWQAGRYPVDYFRGPVGVLLTYVVPVAFATTFPTQALLGEVNLWSVPVGITVACVALFASHRFWTFAVRRYSSASS